MGKQQCVSVKRKEEHLPCNSLLLDELGHAVAEALGESRHCLHLDLRIHFQSDGE